jgi:hypothetical protein
MMTDEEVGALAVDIKTAGLSQPIVLIEDAGEKLILDGRNRMRACEIAGVTPKTIMFGGDDPYTFVVSANLHRRHLSSIERSLVAERMATMRGGNPQLYPPGKVGQSRADAAALLHVTPQSIDRVRVLMRDGVPELVEAVRTERVTLSAGAELARRPEVEQRERLASGDAAVAAWSNGRHKGRAARGLSPKPRPSFVHNDKQAREIKPGLVLVKSALGAETPEKTGVWDDRVALARRLAERGEHIADISERTGIGKSTLWKLIRDHRPKKSPLAGALDDVTTFAESWNRYARDLPAQWKSATDKEWEQLSEALRAASKAAMKMVRRLNKEATEVIDEAREAEAE